MAASVLTRAQMSVVKSSLSIIHRSSSLGKLTQQSTRSFCCSRNLRHALKENFIQAQEARGSRTVICRTSQADPAMHTTAHQGLFYTVEPAAALQYTSRAVPSQLLPLHKAFNETAIMVREPAVELMHSLQHTNFGLPINRYVLYGRTGCGKSMTLSHLLHFAGSQGYIIAHLPWASYLNRYAREFTPSTTHPGYFDQPLDAIDLLTYFKKINADKLKELDLRMTDTYQWNKRESSESGSPLLEMLEFGLARSKYVCDVMGAVFHELKVQAAEKGFKVLVVVDGANAFWTDSKYKAVEDKRVIHGNQWTIAKHFMDLLTNDWVGGAGVCTVDVKASPQYQDESIYLPRGLLTKPGFEFFDPFIPIHVDRYTDKEAQSALDYLIDRGWITNPAGQTEDGKAEILHLACNNPQQLVEVTRSW